MEGCSKKEGDKLSRKIREIKEGERDCWRENSEEEGTGESEAGNETVLGQSW